MIAEKFYRFSDLRLKTVFKAFRSNKGYLPATMSYGTSGPSSRVPGRERHGDLYLEPQSESSDYEAMSAGTTPVALHMKDTNLVPNFWR